MRRALPAILLLLALPACKPPNPPVQQAMAALTSPTGGQASAIKVIVTEWRAKRVKFEDVLTFAFDQIDSVKKGTPVGTCTKVPTSADATAFAGAVLDASLILEHEFPTNAEQMVLFWHKVGGLAFAAAEEARANNRGPEALVLVMGGSRQWQNDAYWYLHPTHDGLASWLLAESGDKGAAITRLRDRVELQGFAKETYDMLTKSP